MRSRPFIHKLIIRNQFLTIILSCLIMLSAQISCVHAVSLSSHPIAAKILEHARKCNLKASLFGGTARDILMNKPIPDDDEYDILLPPAFVEGELTLEQRDFIKTIEKIAGGKNRCHFIYPQGRENFKKLYSIGGLSINKIVISSDLRIIDRNKGISDIRNKLLRHVPGADVYWPSFLPVFDVLRGIRFLSQYKGFTLDPMTSKYYQDSVNKIMADSTLIHRILTIFKNISQGKQHSDGFPGTGKDFIRTKVQIRGIKKRLDKIFDCALDPQKAELLLEKFKLKSFFKRLRWPEKDYIVSKMDPKRFIRPEKKIIASNQGYQASGSSDVTRAADSMQSDLDGFDKSAGGMENDSYQDQETEKFADNSYDNAPSFERKMQERFENEEADNEPAEERFDVYKNNEDEEATEQYADADKGEDNFVDPFEDIDFEDFDLEDF